MDLNIGAALWLATRAEGPVRQFCGAKQPVPGNLQVHGQCYKSAARVVLVGHGADEQCAGYGRHRTKFRQQVD